MSFATLSPAELMASYGAKPFASLVAAVAEANAENITRRYLRQWLRQKAQLSLLMSRPIIIAVACWLPSVWQRASGTRAKSSCCDTSPAAKATEQREAGFLEAMAKVKEIEVISSDQYAGTTPEKRWGKATQLLNKYRDEVNGIFAVCEPNCNGTLEALKQTGLAGKVQFVAFDPSESLIQGLADKSVAGIVLQDPYEMGRQSVIALSKHIKGETVEAVLSTGDICSHCRKQRFATHRSLAQAQAARPVTTVEPASSHPLLEMQGISKSFGATRALDDVSLSVAAGQVLALIGENGAGKSTLMKVLSGAHRPDAGSMYLAGSLFQPSRQVDSRRAGVAMIYQELNLAPDLSVEENVLLGIERSRLGFVRQSVHRGKSSASVSGVGTCRFTARPSHWSTICRCSRSSRLLAVWCPTRGFFDI